MQTITNIAGLRKRLASVTLMLVLLGSFLLPFTVNRAFAEDEHQTVYCIKNGFVAKDYTGAADMSVDVYDHLNHIVPQRSWWRIENGKVNFNFSGMVKYNGKTYQVTRGAAVLVK